MVRTALPCIRTGITMARVAVPPLSVQLRALAGRVAPVAPADLVVRMDTVNIITPTTIATAVVPATMLPVAARGAVPMVQAALEGPVAVVVLEAREAPEVGTEPTAVMAATVAVVALRALGAMCV